jgi:hypothetical protein
MFTYEYRASSKLGPGKNEAKDCGSEILGWVPSAALVRLNIRYPAPQCTVLRTRLPVECWQTFD